MNRPAVTCATKKPYVCHRLPTTTVGLGNRTLLEQKNAISLKTKEVRICPRDPIETALQTRRISPFITPQFFIRKPGTRNFELSILKCEISLKCCRFGITLLYNHCKLFNINVWFISRENKYISYKLWLHVFFLL